MKILRLIPLLAMMTACSSVNVPVSPYRIDVQQGNALEQEAVEKLKVGMTRAQVRFLLGTPMLIDPFRSSRWDYVYNFRKSGKLTEKRRLALFFEGDVLTRIESEGFTSKEPAPVVPVNSPAAAEKTEKPVISRKPADEKTAVTAPSPLPVVAMDKVAAKPAQAPQAVTASAVEPTQAQAPQAIVPQMEKKAEKAAETPVVAQTGSTPASTRKATADRSLNETSIVPPMATNKEAGAKNAKARVTGGNPLENMALQTETNVAAVKPDDVPAFPRAVAEPTSAENQVLAALNKWAEAWKARDEEAYLAAYAPNFLPGGDISRAEWEKRRRLLLGVSRNIDLKIDGHAFESVTEDRVQVSFRQFYKSDSYQDAVIKQLKYVRVDNLWLIEEEKILAPIKVKK